MERRELLRLLAAGGLAAATGCRARSDSITRDSLGRLDCIGQHDLVVSGLLSARELVSAAIDRIEAVNPTINAVIHHDYERALSAADAARGQLAGVPYLLKDLNAFADMPQNFGSAAFRDFVPTSQTAFTDRIEAAGLIVIGKTNTPEFGLLPSTSPTLHGPTRNPWNINHTPGGSSGGAAAAVAARLVPAAQAGDGGGSIRIPAAQCGLFGLKPTQGRFPDQGTGDQPWPISVKHAITLSVRDSALLLALTEVTAGGAWLPVGFVGRERLRPMRIALSFTTTEGAPDEDVRAAVQASADALSDLGHTIVPTEETPHADSAFGEHFLTLYGAGAHNTVSGVRERLGDGADDNALFEPATLALAEEYLRRPQGALNAALDWFPGFQARMDGFFEDYDAWLSPVTASAAPEIGFLDPAVPYRTLTERVRRFAAYTPAHNVAGTPAMSVPAGRNEAGLPIGAQIAAARGAEHRLLQLAYQLEEAMPWRNTLPPVHA